jgi:uncharacterized membrane protein YhaH (DUF805 family)
MATWSSRPAAKGLTVNFLGLMFGFKGRITRAQFWLAALIWLLAFPGAQLFAGGVMAVLQLKPSYGLIIPLVSAVLIPTLVSMVAVGTKRLHDRDKRGWWVLLFLFGPYVFAPLFAPLPLLLLSEDPSGMELLAWLLVTVGPFAIWGVVELGVMAGTPGPNRFGDPPSSDRAMQAA